MGILKIESQPLAYIYLLCYLKIEQHHIVIHIYIYVQIPQTALINRKYLYQYTSSKLYSFIYHSSCMMQILKKIQREGRST